jgi:hypothetical protein
MKTDIRALPFPREPIHQESRVNGTVVASPCSLPNQRVSRSVRFIRFEAGRVQNPARIRLANGDRDGR